MNQIRLASYDGKDPLIRRKAELLFLLTLITILLNILYFAYRSFHHQSLILPGLFISTLFGLVTAILLFKGYFKTTVIIASLSCVLSFLVGIYNPSADPFLLIAIPIVLIFFLFYTKKIYSIFAMIFCLSLPVLFHRIHPGIFSTDQLIHVEFFLTILSVLNYLMINILNIDIREKSALLNEIHHRVFNNLQLTIGMLNIQMMSLSAEDSCRIVLSDIKNRLYAVSEVHRQLYQTHNFSRLRFDDVIRSVGRELLSAGSRFPGIIIKYDCEVVILDIAQSIPCALIMFELVANAYRHGSIGTDEKAITISVKRKSNTVTMTVRDTGPGIPENFSLEQTETIGFTMIQTLLKQINGKMEYRNDGGAVFSVLFQA